MAHDLPNGTVLHTVFGSRYVVADVQPFYVPAGRIGVRDENGRPTYLHPTNIARIERVSASAAPVAQASPPRGSVSNSFGHFPTATGDDADWNERLVELAVDHERTVVFDYRDAAGATSVREVTPEAVHTSGAGNKYFVAVDNNASGAHADREFRAFRFDRIAGTVEAI